MPVTLKDIATATSLSIRSVSQILNTDQGHAFRAETRKRVIATAKQLGYLPSAQARSMKTGRVGALGLLLSTIPQRSVLDYPVLVGIQEELGLRDMHTVVGRLPDDELVNVERMPRILREWSTDGLMILYTQKIPPTMIDLVQSHRTPSIWINARLDGDCVHPDDFEAGYRLTKQLTDAGHRRIAYVVGYPNDHYSRRDRIDGYLAAMRGYGSPNVIDLNPALNGNELHRISYAPLEKMLATPCARPTAIVAGSPAEARGVYGAARSAGLSVPRDLSVVTFLQSDTDVDGMVISGLALPQHQLGRAAAAMTCEKVANPTRVFPALKIPFESTAGDTFTRVPI